MAAWSGGLQMILQTFPFFRVVKKLRCLMGDCSTTIKDIQWSGVTWEPLTGRRGCRQKRRDGNIWASKLIFGGGKNDDHMAGSEHFQIGHAPGLFPGLQWSESVRRGPRRVRWWPSNRAKLMPAALFTCGTGPSRDLPGNLGSYRPCWCDWHAHASIVTKFTLSFNIWENLIG